MSTSYPNAGKNYNRPITSFKKVGKVSTFGKESSKPKLNSRKN
jgi:hypothetical protein